jgi:hypothetical protein
MFQQASGHLQEVFFLAENYKNFFARRSSLTLREKHRLRVLVNRVLRRIFGSKRDAVNRGVETTA